jgi:hypothetical protein
MVQAYDHRAASVVARFHNLNRPNQPVSATLAEHEDLAWLPTPLYWIDAKRVREVCKLDWLLCFKDVMAPTNVRTMIAAIVPAYGLGNTLPAFLDLPDARSRRTYSESAPLLLANLNGLAFDYVLRQKIQGQHINLYILEQCPLIHPRRFGEDIGKWVISDFVREEVLRLSYTAQDLKPFAQDMGYVGEPFVWNEEDRRHRLARLDALFFHLYGVGRDDVAYILDTFPIVRKADEAAFGRFHTKKLVLGYMNAVAAGDLETRIDA